MTKELETGGPAFPTDSEGWLTPDQMHYQGMTTRTYAAIHLRVPMSEHDWLNDMIRASQRAEFAKAAMQGICASGPGPSWTNDALAKEAFGLTDAMLAEQEKK